MTDFLLAVIIIIGLSGVFIKLHKRYHHWTEQKKLDYVERKKTKYSSYRFVHDNCAIRFDIVDKSIVNEPFSLDVIPAIREVFVISSTETHETWTREYVFNAVKADILALELPLHAGFDYSLEPTLTGKTLGGTEHRVDREEILHWLTEFAEQYKVSTNSIEIQSKGFEYRYRISLRTLPFQKSFYGRTLEKTAWQPFPGRPKVRSLRSKRQYPAQT